MLIGWLTKFWIRTSIDMAGQRATNWCFLIGITFSVSLINGDSETMPLTASGILTPPSAMMTSPLEADPVSTILPATAPLPPSVTIQPTHDPISESAVLVSSTMMELTSVTLNATDSRTISSCTYPFSSSNKDDILLKTSDGIQLTSYVSDSSSSEAEISPDLTSTDYLQSLIDVDSSSVSELYPFETGYSSSPQRPPVGLTASIEHTSVLLQNTSNLLDAISLLVSSTSFNEQISDMSSETAFASLLSGSSETVYTSLPDSTRAADISITVPSYEIQSSIDSSTFIALDSGSVPENQISQDSSISESPVASESFMETLPPSTAFPADSTALPSSQANSSEYTGQVVSSVTAQPSESITVPPPSSDLITASLEDTDIMSTVFISATATEVESSISSSGYEFSFELTSTLEQSSDELTVLSSMESSTLELASSRPIETTTLLDSSFVQTVPTTLSLEPTSTILNDLSIYVTSSITVTPANTEPVVPNPSSSLPLMSSVVLPTPAGRGPEQPSNTGATVAIAIVVILVVLLVIGGGVFYYRRCYHARRWTPGAVAFKNSWSFDNASYHDDENRLIMPSAR